MLLIKMSGMMDLNHRSPTPKAGAIPDFANSRFTVVASHNWRAGFSPASSYQQDRALNVELPPVIYIQRAKHNLSRCAKKERPPNNNRKEGELLSGDLSPNSNFTSEYLFAGFASRTVIYSFFLAAKMYSTLPA